MTKQYPLEEFISTLLFLADDIRDLTLEEGSTLTKYDFQQLVTDTIDLIGCADCAICGVDCCEINEYYMVHNDLWEQYGVVHGMLCVSCLEQRMRRELTAADFMPGAGDNILPINGPDQHHSARLTERLRRQDEVAAQG